MEFEGYLGRRKKWISGGGTSEVFIHFSKERKNKHHHPIIEQKVLVKGAEKHGAGWVGNRYIAGHITDYEGTFSRRPVGTIEVGVKLTG